MAMGRSAVMGTPGKPAQEHRCLPDSVRIGDHQVLSRCFRRDRVFCLWTFIYVYVYVTLWDFYQFLDQIAGFECP